MSVQSIFSGSTCASQSQAVSAVTSGTSPASSTGTGEVRHHRGGGQAFINSLMQALSQSGVTTPTDASGGSSTSSNAIDATQGGSSSVGAALHAFMHSLFSSLQQAGGAASTGSGADTDGDQDGSGTTAVGQTSPYQSASSNLESLIQQLNGSAGGASSTGTGTNSLQGAFDNLVSALQGASSSAGTSTSSNTTQSPTLLTFLQNLAQDMGVQQNNLSGSATGGLLQTTG